jgi:hypothetical protein
MTATRSTQAQPLRRATHRWSLILKGAIIIILAAFACGGAASQTGGSVVHVVAADNIQPLMASPAAAGHKEQPVVCVPIAEYGSIQVGMHLLALFVGLEHGDFVRTAHTPARLRRQVREPLCRPNMHTRVRLQFILSWPSGTRFWPSSTFVSRCRRLLARVPLSAAVVLPSHTHLDWQTVLSRCQSNELMLSHEGALRETSTEARMRSSREDSSKSSLAHDSLAHTLHQSALSAEIAFLARDRARRAAESQSNSSSTPVGCQTNRTSAPSDDDGIDRLPDPAFTELHCAYSNLDSVPPLSTSVSML